VNRGVVPSGNCLLFIKRCAFSCSHCTVLPPSPWKNISGQYLEFARVLWRDVLIFVVISQRVCVGVLHLSHKGIMVLVSPGPIIIIIRLRLIPQTTIAMTFRGALNMAFHIESFRDLHWDFCMVLSWVPVNKVIIITPKGC
jgi:hypothetical protein